MNDRGVMTVAGDPVSHPSTRLEVVDWHCRHSELARNDATPPILLGEAPLEKHGGHRYAFADTGLDAGALRARTRRYQESFDVPSAG